MSYTVKVTPLSEREAIIDKRVKASNESGETIYDFRSGTYAPKTVSLPIDIPVYRMENCRAFSAQQTEIARNKHYGKDFFRKGQELTQAQQAQHEIMVKLAEREKEGSVARIMDVLRKEGQRESILITSGGVVVNGNRRLSAMRELMRPKDGSIDERFANVRCDVLPPDTIRDEIDDLEADLQARPQTKLEYDWIGDAHLIKRQISKKNRTAKDVAARLHRKEADIKNVLDALGEADLYLSEWARKPGEYNLLQDGQQIFGDIPKNLDKKSENLKYASRVIAWSLYDNRDKISGRVYRLNAAFGKLAPSVLKNMKERLNLEDVVDDSADVDDEDIIIDVAPDEGAEDYKSVINALRSDSTKEVAVDALLDVCESVIELEKGHKNSQAALRALIQINNKIAGVPINSAAKNTFEKMLEQIESSRKGLDKIEKTIEARKAGKKAVNADV